MPRALLHWAGSALVPADPPELVDLAADWDLGDRVLLANRSRETGKHTILKILLDRVELVVTQ